MAALFLWGLFSDYLDDVFAIFQKLQKAKLFGNQFDNIGDDLWIRDDGEKEQLGSNIDFLRLEFDTLLIETRLQKDKLKKAMERVSKRQRVQPLMLMKN